MTLRTTALSGLTSARQRRGEATDDSTPQRILDVAERLVQDRGYNSFSYADIAAQLGITKPALHYHFANKADLGRALIERYTVRFLAGLAAIDGSEGSAAVKLRSYAHLYETVLTDGRMCLCGMLAAEYRTLPESMQSAVVAFFNDNESWLEHVLERGRTDGSLHFAGPARLLAHTVMSCLEGAMLVARPFNDVTRFQASTSYLLDNLTTT